MLGAVSINWLAVLLALGASMAVGFLWYAPQVFGGAWMRWTGLTPETTKASAARAGVLALGLSLVAVVAMALVVDWTRARTWQDGLTLGLAVGAIAATVGAVHPLFEGRHRGVSLLYAVHHLVEFTLVGVILAAWQ